MQCRRCLYGDHPLKITFDKDGICVGVEYTKKKTNLIGVNDG